MNLLLQKWKKDEEFFVETTSSEYVMGCLRKEKCVLVVGPPGVGKTFLVHHVALEIEKHGFNIIIVSTPKDIEREFKLNKKTLFDVDGMFGDVTPNTARLDEWIHEMKNLTYILDKYPCKLIVACRLQIFQDKLFNHSQLKLFKKCICNLADKKIALKKEEKDKLARMYSLPNQYEVERLYKYYFFPHLCKLYKILKDKSKFSLDRFFQEPFAIFKSELDDIFFDCKEGKYKIIALLLLVIRNNHLEGKVLTGEDDTQTINDKWFGFVVHYFGAENEVTRFDSLGLLMKHADKGVCERLSILKRD